VAHFPYFSMEDADEALQKLKDANVSDYMIAYVWLAMKSATKNCDTSPAMPSLVIKIAGWNQHPRPWEPKKIPILVSV
jgi:hypothetical protein